VKATHRIRVLGRELQVKGDAPAEVVQEVEVFVNERLAEVAASLPHADQQLVTLLALLNIAEAYLTLRRQNNLYAPEGEELLARLLRKMDQALE
jgi:cell division protein ZapA